jgi:hypothetical protein
MHNGIWLLMISKILMSCDTNLLDKEIFIKMNFTFLINNSHNRHVVI